MSPKNTLLTPNLTLNCKGILVDLTQPLVMGILNVTPDSFFDGGKHNQLDAALNKAESMINAGADILDIGGMSSRPGAEVLTPEEECERVLPIIRGIHQTWPDQIMSIDTVHAKVAKAAIESGAHIVNDISAGSIDPLLLPTVAALNVPYILMHMRGQPDSMQQEAAQLDKDHDIIEELLHFFTRQLESCQKLGIKDVIIDLGFGFGKRLEDNYLLLRRMKEFQLFQRPILVGTSRKSMIYKLLDKRPDGALNGTTITHVLALQNGASILRVHDVEEAKECVKILNYLADL